jgi:hypothetical protein
MSSNSLPPILNLPLLVEWLLGCGSNRGRQDEFENCINDVNRRPDCTPIGVATI